MELFFYSFFPSFLPSFFSFAYKGPLSFITAAEKLIPHLLPPPLHKLDRYSGSLNALSLFQSSSQLVIISHTHTHTHNLTYNCLINVFSRSVSFKGVRQLGPCRCFVFFCFSISFTVLLACYLAHRGTQETNDSIVLGFITFFLTGKMEISSKYSLNPYLVQDACQTRNHFHLEQKGQETLSTGSCCSSE